MHFKKVTHVIFDMDGLLIDSESVYNKIINDIAKKYDKECVKEVTLKVLGTTEPDTAKVVVRELELPISPEEFLTIYKAKVKEELRNSALMPGAKDLLLHLHKHNIPIAVATSASQAATELKTKHLQDLFKVFNHIVCGSSDPDVKQGKPAPDIFLVCASRFPEKPDPSQCLVFEDAPNGVRGAIAAGMQAVLVPDEYITEELKQGATLVLNSLIEFKPELFGLPAFT